MTNTHPGGDQSRKATEEPRVRFCCQINRTKCKKNVLCSHHVLGVAFVAKGLGI